MNKTGGITVMGTVDCTAAVAEHWGGLQNVPPDTIVLVNMSWTAWQAVGRKVISATLDDSQASPCWANTAEWLEPGRCVQATGDTWGPCRWDSSNWGSSGYVYGTGKFTTGRVHVQARMTGYFETVPDLIEGFFRISDVDTVAVRDR